MRLPIAIPILLLTALPALATTFGLEELHLDPPVPTSSTLVELRAGGSGLGGGPDAVEMSISGNVITVDLVASSDAPGVLLAILPWGVRTPLGRFPAGTYQVVIRDAHQEVLATRQLTVLGLYENPADFERVLLPFLYSGPGAFGAQWQTIATVQGGRPVPALPLMQRPNGAVLSLTLDQARSSSFSLRFRDTARMPNAFGTRVPVVYTRDTAAGLVLQDVPLDPRFRRTLRIYDIDGEPRQLFVAMRRPDGTLVNAVAGPRSLARGCDGEPCDAPGYLQLDLDSLLAPGTRREGVVDVIINSVQLAVPRLWAMVSVTDNETQETTIVAPR